MSDFRLVNLLVNKVTYIFSAKQMKCQYCSEKLFGSKELSVHCEKEHSGNNAGAYKSDVLKCFECDDVFKQVYNICILYSFAEL
jgi:hypothetical protein